MNLTFANLAMQGPIIKRNAEPEHRPPVRRNGREVRSEHERVLNVLRFGDKTSRELEDALKLDKSQTASLMRQLTRRGLVTKTIVSISVGTGGRKAVWRLK